MVYRTEEIGVEDGSKRGRTPFLLFFPSQEDPRESSGDGEEKTKLLAGQGKVVKHLVGARASAIIIFMFPFSFFFFFSQKKKRKFFGRGSTKKNQ